MQRSDRRNVTLGGLIDSNAASLQTGPFGSQLHASDYVPSGIPVIPTEAIGRRAIVSTALPQVSEGTAARLSRHLLRPGDILFARRGVQATGLSAIVTERHAGALCSTGAIRLRLSSVDLDPQFVSFWLSTPRSIEWIKAHAVGGVMPNVNEPVLRLLPIEFPEIGEQRAIATLLGAIDEKIELNSEVNRKLERLATALFRSWFVDFDPVVAKRDGRTPIGVQAAAIDLFPSHFEDSELGAIPKGWRVGRVGEVARDVRTQASPRDVSPDTPYIGLEHMPRRSICLDQWGRASDATSGKLRFKEGALLFGKLRPYFHKVGVAQVAGVCSTDIVVVEPSEADYMSLVLGHLSSVEFVDYNDAGSGGTRMPRTSWELMSRYPIVVPPAAPVRPRSAGRRGRRGQRACRAHGRTRYRRAMDQCDGGWRPYAGVSTRDDPCGVCGVPKAGSEAPAHGLDQPGLAMGRRAGDHGHRRAADIADTSMLAQAGEDDVAIRPSGHGCDHI